MLDSMRYTIKCLDLRIFILGDDKTFTAWSVIKTTFRFTSVAEGLKMSEKTKAQVRK